MNAQHTPRPWHFRLEAVRTVIYRKSKMGEQALAVGAGHYPVHIANARLIAAAPDMLAALEGLLSRYDGFSDENLPVTGIWHDQIINARAAVAKAKGPQL